MPYSIIPSNQYVSHETRNLLFQLTKIGDSSNVILGHQSTNTLSHLGNIDNNFLMRYPGDDYVDLLSIDFYDS